MQNLVGVCSVEFLLFDRHIIYLVYFLKNNYEIK